MKQVTKKYFDKHAKKGHHEIGHYEGKYWCNCKVRGWRLWMALKNGYYKDKE